ncbi:MAG: hypothetical protein P8Z36_00835, partial [Gemmatimonadota bacterium]
QHGKPDQAGQQKAGGNDKAGQQSKPDQAGQPQNGGNDKAGQHGKPDQASQPQNGNNDKAGQHGKPDQASQPQNGNNDKAGQQSKPDQAGQQKAGGHAKGGNDQSNKPKEPSAPAPAAPTPPATSEPEPAAASAPPSATIPQLLASESLVGQQVQVTGVCLARKDQSAAGNAPKGKDDWQLGSDGGAIWVVGARPAGCGAGTVTIVARVGQDRLPSRGKKTGALRRYLVIE